MISFSVTRRMRTSEESAVTLVAIDDDPMSLELITDALEQANLNILTATDAQSGLALIREKRPEIALLDLLMPGVSGMELLEKILEFSPETEVMLVTGHYSTESAVEAIRKGASDYITKPLSVPQLRQRIDALIASAQRRRAAARLDSELLRASEFEGIVGRSPEMLDVFSRIRRVAPHFKSVLITGETGTGKELVARAMHRMSPAASGPFAVCNASAVVETLLKVNCLVTNAARSRARHRTRWDCLSTRPAVQSSSTKLAICLCPRKQSCCVCSKRTRCSVWERSNRGKWMSESLRRPTGHCAQ
jgi:DNA-binding NtrC family response regulator